MLERGRSYSGRERNCCFLNTSAAKVEEVEPGSVARFANISATSGIDLPDDGRALVAVDWDHDGDLDLWISNRNAPRLRFFRNDVPSRNHHLALRLEGNASTTNRDAIGARVEVLLAPTGSNDKSERPLVQTLRAGESFLSQSSKWLHFGLGDVAKIESVQVQWPGGEMETFSGLSVDGRYQLVQGSGQAKSFPPRTSNIALAPTPLKLPAKNSVARIPLMTLLPLRKMNYQTFSGKDRSLPTGQRKPILLNLWASWCRPCIAELKEICDREQEIRSAGIEVVALSVDGLGDQHGSASAAKNVVDGLKFPCPTGHATGKIVSYLQEVHDQLITSSQPLPAPVSFLIDKDDRITVIYKGRLSIDQVLKDLNHSQGTMSERFARSAPIPGRTLPIPTVSRRLNQFEARFRFTTYLRDIGFNVERENQALVELFPENAGTHSNLGISYIKQQRFSKAEACFREAVRVNPEFGEAHANLGIVLAQQAKIDEAIGHLKQAVSIDPHDEKTLEILGGLLIQRKRWSEAELNLEQAIAINSLSADTHAHLGHALAAQKKYAQAVEHLEKAIELQPDHAAAKKNLKLVRGLIKEGKS